MSELKRREFLSLLGAAPLALRFRAESKIRVGYAAITWGGDDPKAIDEVAAVGFKGIQLRASAFDRWGKTPADLPLLAGPEREPPKSREVFIYMINGFKPKAPAAAMALIERLGEANTIKRSLATIP